MFDVNKFIGEFVKRQDVKYDGFPCVIIDGHKGKQSEAFMRVMDDVIKLHDIEDIKVTTMYRDANGVVYDEESDEDGEIIDAHPREITITVTFLHRVTSALGLYGSIKDAMNRSKVSICANDGKLALKIVID